MDKEQLASELMAGFHRQFAENQRSKENWFLQAVGYLGAIVFGYAWTLHRFDFEESYISLAKLTYVMLGVVILLGAGAWIAVATSLSWRRDQLVNMRIRRYAGLMGGRIAFPQAYDPSDAMRRQWVRWMPDQFIVSCLLFPVFQSLVIWSFVQRIHGTFEWKSRDGWITLASVIAIPCVLLVVYAPWHYRRKGLAFLNNVDRESPVATPNS